MQTCNYFIQSFLLTKFMIPQKYLNFDIFQYVLNVHEIKICLGQMIS